MKIDDPRQRASVPPAQNPRRHALWLLVLGAIALFLALAGRSNRRFQEGVSQPVENAGTWRLTRTGSLGAPAAVHRQQTSATETVTAKLGQYSRARREIAEAMARKFGVELSPEVERFFDAAEAGHREELETIYNRLKQQRLAGDNSIPEPIRHVLLEVLGVHDMAHRWPPQQLLDYGHELLATLEPGMVYVGGTDPGRYIPTLLNETSEGERHLLLTQNAFADPSYLEYVEFLYGDQLKLPGKAERDAMFNKVVTTYGVAQPDGKLQVSGQPAVMAINELILEGIRQKNPDLRYAYEESFPFSSLYAGATPAGPVMILGGPGEPGNATAENAASSVSYWQQTSSRLLGNAESAASPETLKTYSHMAVSQANLFASQSHPAEAEQTYRIAQQLYPANPEPVAHLAELYEQNGRAAEATQLVQNYAQLYPDQKETVEQLRGWNKGR